MPVTNKSFDFHSWAVGKVYTMLRADRIGKKRARRLAEQAVLVSGPGRGHREIRYRVSPAGDGWWITEWNGGDAHDEPELTNYFVPEANVKRLWRIVKKLVPVSAKYRLSTDSQEVPASYRFGLQDVAKVLRQKHLLPKRMDTLSVGGGKRRRAYYFPMYLYPARVLDFLGRIRFGATSWRLE